MTENKRFIPIFDGIDKRVVGAKNNGVIISFKDMFNLLNELHEENEQLKQSQARMLRELLIYRRIASCSNCEYQNYDWFEDGDEFEICEKGNINQQIEYHICKEWRKFE